MNNPDLYNKYNLMTKNGAIECLEEYAEKIKWRNNNDTVIDMGCGDGSVTAILKRYIPVKDVTFIATDISEKMIAYAKEHYSEENIIFKVLDMAGDLPDDLNAKFNHVFSFYTVQFIKEQEKAFRNVYDLLTQGGDCFICFLRTMPYYNLCIQASQQNKWKPWIKDVNKFISPYHYIQNPEENITQMLKTIGFNNIEVKCKNMKHVMKDGNEVKSFLKAIQPFDLPSDVFEEFAKDNVELAKDLGLLGENCKSFEDEHEPVDYRYQLLIVYATKP